MKLSHNICLNTDSYKVGMDLMYPEGTTKVYSYIEARGGIYDQTVFFGLQAFIKEYLVNPITQEDIDIADEILTAHGEPFNRARWQYILDNHNGYLPIVIKAVPEGTVVPVKQVLATIENTDPECFWLTTWVETALLRAIWYPTTVATQSWEIRQLINGFLERTGDPALIDFKLHDFGARGVSSLESASIGGAAHLVNFMGTDTISGLLFAREYYNAGVAGYSIPASEHSIATSFGR
jgi:nicotinamide phosphoribosyltransferase